MHSRLSRSRTLYPYKNGFEPAWFLMKYPTNNRFAEQSYRVSSLFSLLSSLEKVEVKNREKREERIVKSEENKKKKPLARLFLFGGRETIRPCIYAPSGTFYSNKMPILKRHFQKMDSFSKRTFLSPLPLW